MQVRQLTETNSQITAHLSDVMEQNAQLTEQVLQYEKEKRKMAETTQKISDDLNASASRVCTVSNINSPSSNSIFVTIYSLHIISSLLFSLSLSLSILSIYIYIYTHLSVTLSKSCSSNNTSRECAGGGGVGSETRN